MGNASSRRKVTKSQFHFDALPKATKTAFEYLAKNGEWLADSSWYLAGGTALALQVGHRQSVDLDFFSPKKEFDEVALERTLFSTGKWNTTSVHRGTIYGRLAGAKASFIAYPFFTGYRGLLKYGSVRIMPIKEIAVMKLIAVGQRGRKRDFVDLYWYCTHKESLYEIISRVGSRYRGQEDNLHHILKSLMYFADAEEDVSPHLNFQASWEDMKLFFQTEVPRVIRKLGIIV